MENPNPPKPLKRQRTGGRSATVLRAVADAVLDELVASGVAGFSVPRVASRAGVNSSSIYRRWPTKTELIGYAGAQWAQTVMPPPDLGSLRADLLGMLENGVKFVSDPRGRALIAMNFGDHGPAVDQLAPSAYWQQRLVQYQAMFDRAVQRGELPPDTHTEAILELAIGPLYARTFISRRPVTPAFLAHVVDAALAGRLCAHPPSSNQASARVTPG